MIKSNSVERVLKGKTSLDLVSHDHTGKNVLDGERRFSVGDVGSRDPVGNRTDGTKVVTRVL